jgi:hypothetical protein
MHLDMDSFLIGISTFASITMATWPEHFDDLILTKKDGIVKGIEGCLAFKGKGTFKFNIEDNHGKVHHVKIPNSAYVPGLKYCLLSPQHWVQEAKDKFPLPRGTRMENDDEAIILLWGQGKCRQTVPHSPNTNTPVFRTAQASYTYRAFVANVKAMEAQYYHNEKVLLLPGQRHQLIDQPEFMAEENDLLPNKKDTLASEGATVDDETVKASNLTTTQPTSKESTATQVGPLTFDPSPQLEDDEQHVHVASDEQAELMRWYYCLGHLAFSKLKQLALNNKIPKQLAKIKPPVCAGCLFGDMTRVPW